MEIPGTVTSIGSDAFYRCKRLISITIPNSVTSIGDAAFRECESLTNVTIPDSVTSIEREAFSYCKSLTSVTIPDSVTDIGHGAFIGCESLKSVTIFASVASIDYSIFYECANLEEFTCPDTFASLLPQILPATKAPIILHIPDISGVGVKFRPGAAVGFAEDTGTVQMKTAKSTSGTSRQTPSSCRIGNETSCAAAFDDPRKADRPPKTLRQ